MYQKPKKSKGFASKMAADTTGGQLNPEAAKAAAAASAVMDPPPAKPAAAEPAPAPAPAKPAAAEPQPAPEPVPAPAPAKTTPEPAKVEEIKMRGIPGAASAEPEPGPAKFDEAEFDRETKEQFGGKPEGPAYEAWKTLRNELKTYKKGELLPDPIKQQLTEREELAKKVEIFEAEVGGLREKVTKLSSNNAVSMVEASDVYEQSVLAPEKAIASGLEALEQVSKIKVDTLNQVVNEPDFATQDAMIEKLGEQMSPRHLARLQTACDDKREIERIRGELLTDAEQVLATQKAEREERKKAEIAQHIQEVRQYGLTEHDTYLKEIPGMLDENGRPSATAATIQRQIAASDPAAMSRQDEGYAIYAGVALPHVSNLLAKANARIQALEKEINAKESAVPNPGTVGKPTSGPMANTPQKSGREGKGLLGRMASQQFTA